ncbi:MAG TPA: GntR family transcriptional regulator [Anaerolineales bacterium]|nr:GntR family transcriptional regulator [Anaerolineales bacterium]
MSSKKPKPSPTHSNQPIADRLRADILRGALQGGQALKQDEIASRFGVSKIPVREALMQLKAEGLVVFYPNRGAFVAELSAAEADEIYVMRIALEKEALARAIPRLTISDLKRASDLLAAIDREENITKWGELNWEFHATLYAPASLPRVMENIRTLHTNIARYLVLYLAGMDYQKKSQREHRALLQACRAGDVEKAQSILEEHLRSAAIHLIQFLNPPTKNQRRR